MKSLYQRLGEATEKLADAGKFKQYREASANCTSLEAKLNCAEKLLAAPVKESRTITKHNGASDNGHELFTESNRGERFTEQDKQNAYAKGDKLIREAMGIPEPKGKPEAYDKLTEAQRKEYDFCRLIGISESDALSVVNATGGYNGPRQRLR